MPKTKKFLAAKEKHTKALKRWARAKKEYLAHPKNKKLREAFDRASAKYQQAEDEYHNILSKMPGKKTPSEDRGTSKIPPRTKKTYTRCDSILEALSEKSEWVKKDLVRRADDLYREHGGDSNLHISQVAMQYAIGYLVPMDKLEVVKRKIFVK